MLEWIISSSVLIAVVIALRFALKGKISLRLQYALWALVLVRLLIPFSFGSSSISVMNSVEQSTVYQTTSQVVTTVQVPSDIIRDSELTIEEAEQVGHGTLHRVEGYPAESGRENLHTYSFQDSLKEVGSRILCGCWICGIVIMGGWFTFSNLRLLYQLKKSRALLGNDHVIPVYLSDAVDTPCLFGLFRPAVYLTSEAAADETVSRHAIEHELTHHRHKDHVWAILRCVCLAVHWYNPLVWCAAILSRNDAELACDEATIRRLGENERAAYGRTLIGLTCEKRTALLNTATTMTGSGKSIKERIALIAKKPKMAVYTLIAVLVIAAIAVGCTFTGAKDPSNNSKDPSDHSEEQTEDISTETPPPAEEQTDLFADMEAYVRHRIEQKKTVSYYSATMQDQVTVDVLDAKIAWLEKRGEVVGLAPNGTLEAWSYNILVKPDADPDDIMLVGGQYDEDGYYDLEGQGGRITVALRGADGKYDVLYDAVINDGLDFFSYCNTTEEAIYDWYVKKYDLDLPLYVKDWIDCITQPEGAHLGNIPVHRYDGDGWYIYVPVQTWICPKETEAQVFTSAYYTGSTLKVDYFDYAPEGLSDDHRKQGFTLIDETNLIWSRNSDGVSTRYYCFDAQNGGCWRVTIEWIDANITNYPYIAMEPDILQLMAESFTVYHVDDQTVTSLPVLELSREDYNAVCDAVLSHLRTGWWKGIPLTDCAYESSAFECVYRETKDDYTDWFYGYGGYFGFNEAGDCVEYWYAPCIVTMDSETKQVYQVWWPRDGAYHEMDILEHFPDEIAEFVAEPNEGRYQAILTRLLEIAKARIAVWKSSDPITRLSTLTAADIKYISGSINEPGAAELAQRIGAAMSNRIEQPEYAMSFWSLDIYFSGGPAGYSSTEDEWLAIYAGPEENIVELHYHSEDGKYVTFYCEDEALYQLVRECYHTETTIDEEAFAQFGDILCARSQARVDGSKLNEGYVLPYSGYEIVRFVKVDEFTQDGAKYEVYEWDVAFLHDDPAKVGWAGGMWLDSQLRVRALDLETYFVTRTSGDLVEYQFFFYDLYFGPDEETGKANAYAAITEVFNSALEMQTYCANLTREAQRRFDRNEAPMSILRVDGNRERALIVDGNMLSVLSSAANNLQELDQPDNFRALGGGIYVWFDSTRHLAFFAGEDPFQVLLRYVAPDANEAAVVYHPQLYLYLFASAERENVQLVDLDDDGFFEAILWQYDQNNLIIYDYYGDEIHRIDTNQTIGCYASDYTGLIANIKPEYARMVQAADSDGNISIYRYHNGTFTYECPIDEVLDRVN